jgi:hypothetical protein
MTDERREIIRAAVEREHYWAFIRLAHLRLRQALNQFPATISKRIDQ